VGTTRHQEPLDTVQCEDGSNWTHCIGTGKPQERVRNITEELLIIEMELLGSGRCTSEMSVKRVTDALLTPGSLVRPHFSVCSQSNIARCRGRIHPALL